MAEAFTLRPVRPADKSALARLYPAAFPEEDLLPLVTALADLPEVTGLCATAGDDVVGHVLFTEAALSGTPLKAALLGPLAVAPGWQRQGVGSALLRTGFETMQSLGAARVLVLGDPAYYGRFGFEPETLVAPPYDLPEEWRGAWQGLALSDPQPTHASRLSLPTPWMQPALWRP